MLKKLLTACVIVIALAPQAYAAPRWETVGKTSTGETLSLDVNSVQTKVNAGSWLFFSYRLKGSIETRQSIAKTASCSGGKLSSAKPGWIVDSTSRQVYADSVGSQNLLQRVCQLGKNAYSISNYQTINVYSTTSTQSEKEFVQSLDHLLVSKNNPLVHQYSGSEKIENGNLYCQFRRQGGSFNSYISLIDDGVVKEGATTELREFIKNYQIAVGVASNHNLCTEFKN